MNVTKIDTSLAWRQASAAVSANRDVLLALAGVFFLLPRLAFGLLVPEPTTGNNMDTTQMVEVMRQYYSSAAPYLLPLLVLQGAATLTMVALFTDRRRPTVREALGRGFRGVLTYILAQLLFIFLIVTVGGLVVGAAMAGGTPLTALAMAVVIAAAAYGLLRLALLAPVVVVEQQRNPWLAMLRAWRLASGHVARIAVLLVMMTLVLLVLNLAVVSVTGALTAMVAGPEAARALSTVVEAALTAAYAVYVAAVLAALHSQIVGPNSSDWASVF